MLDKYSVTFEEVGAAAGKGDETVCVQGGSVTIAATEAILGKQLTTIKAEFPGIASV